MRGTHTTVSDLARTMDTLVRYGLSMSTVKALPRSLAIQL
jgi:hypothetical protein